MKEGNGGFLLYLDSGKAKSFKLDKVHADFLDRGCYVFDADPGCEKNCIAILPTTDKYDVILAMGTDGINWGLKPQDIVAWLRRLEKEQPFIVTGVSGEHVSGRFMTRIKQPEELAMRILEFCPNLDCPDPVEDELRKSRTFWLWWT